MKDWCFYDRYLNYINQKRNERYWHVLEKKTTKHKHEKHWELLQILEVNR